MSVDSLSGGGSNPASQQPPSNHSIGHQIHSPGDSINLRTSMMNAASPSSSSIVNSVAQQHQVGVVVVWWTSRKSVVGSVLGGDGEFCDS